MICFDNVSKRYSEGYDALLGVSFELQSGELAFLTGHSGAGKSTLLKLIMLMATRTVCNLSLTKLTTALR